MTDIINVLSDLSAHGALSRAQSNVSHILDIVPIVTIFFAIFWRCNYIGKKAKSNLIFSAVTTVISCFLWFNFTSQAQQLSSGNFSTFIMGLAMSFACAFGTLCLSRSFRTAVFCSSLLTFIGGPIILVIFIVLSVWMAGLSVIICLFAWLGYLFSVIRNWEKPASNKFTIVYILTAIIIPVITAVTNPGKHFINNTTFIDSIINIDDISDSKNKTYGHLYLLDIYGDCNHKYLSSDDSPTYITVEDFYYLTQGSSNYNDKNMFKLSKNDKGYWSITPLMNSLKFNGRFLSSETKIKNNSTLTYELQYGEILILNFEYCK